MSKYPYGIWLKSKQPSLSRPGQSVTLIGVPQPQGVIHAGGAAPGALLAPIPWPPLCRGYFHGWSGTGQEQTYY